VAFTQAMHVQNECVNLVRATNNLHTLLFNFQSTCEWSNPFNPMNDPLKFCLRHYISTYETPLQAPNLFFYYLKNFYWFRETTPNLLKPTNLIGNKKIPKVVPKHMTMYSYEYKII